MEDSLLSLFVDSAREHIESMSNLLVKLEKDPSDSQSFFELYRHAHSLKGSAYMAGFKQMGDLSHAIEDLIKKIYDGELEPQPTIFDAVFRAVDTLKEMLDKGEHDVSELVKSLRRILEGEEVEIEQHARPTQEVNYEADSVRIDYQLIDNIRQLLEELKVASDDYISTVNSARQILEKGRVQSALEALSGLKNQEFYITSLWERIVSGIEKMSLVPLSTLFAGLPRMVRDIARQLGKEVELEIRTGDIRVDRRAIEIIQDPVIHIVRNAIDHGIEPPEVREKKGKPRAGKIIIEAGIHRQELWLKISDDGAGIDWDKVKEKAIKRGLLREKDVDQKSLEAMLFVPGFSTSSFVTTVSGRGIGLDVVKRNLVAIGGDVSIHSERDRGTTLELRLPVYVGLEKAVVMEIGGRIFAYPLLKTRGIADLNQLDTHFAGGVRLIKYNNYYIQLMDLRETMFGEPPSDEGIVMFFVTSRGIGAVMLDRIVDVIEISRKKIPSILENIEGISGITTYRSQVVPIIDIEFWAGASRVGRRSSSAARERSHVGKKALVVEDNRAVRAAIAQVLRGRGFEVHEAGNGREALEILDRVRPDIIITDIEMPEMDGIELLSRIRSNRLLSEIPMVVVTSRNEYRTLREKGADGFMLKSEFDPSRFIELVEFLLERGR